MGALYFSILLSFILGGFISWKFISYRQKRCIEKCKTMGNVSWYSRLGAWPKIKPGIPLGMGLFFLSMFDFTVGSKNIIPGAISAIFFLLVIKWFLYRIPIFSIVDDTIIFWRCFGLISPKKYALSELTHDEHYSSTDNGHPLIIGLYKKGDRIQEIDTTAYEEEKKLLEILRQTPYESEY